MFEYVHCRFNPLTREWVLVSPHRAKRPWQGQVEKTAPINLLQYDPACYLCPGNERAGGIINPDYTGTFAFDNDFNALLPEMPGVKSQVPGSPHLTPDTLFIAKPETGVCRVICFSLRHDLTLPQLSLDEVEAVINTWSEETDNHYKRSEIAYVQVFENKGAVMGCSNPHPHSQVWSQSQIPNEIEKELTSQKDYFRTNKRPMLLDYLAEEQKRAERQQIVLATPDAYLFQFGEQVLSNPLGDSDPKSPLALSLALHKDGVKLDCPELHQNNQG